MSEGIEEFKNHFFEYYTYSDSILNEIWEKGMVVFDTNILLRLYKMSTNARDEFFNILKFGQLNSKLWMPYQVGSEFHRNRKLVIDQALKAISNDKKELDKQINSLQKYIEESANLQLHEELTANIKEVFSSFKTEIHKPLDEYEDKFKQKDFYDKGNLRETDIIVETIAQIYNQKIGNKHSREETSAFYKEGDFRFSKLVPPGFEDIDKNDYRTYGDYIIWEEMMKIAKQEKKPIIFVTGDLKKDWWYIENNKEETRKPLPYLLKEFKDETNQYFYMYTYGSFIEKAKERYSSLPSTEKVTKEMSFLVNKDQSSIENDSYLIKLQNLLNHSNSAIANKAYQDLMRYKSINLSEDQYLIRQAIQYVSQFGPSNISWAKSKFNEIRLNENLTSNEKTQAIRDLYEEIIIKTDFGY